MFEPIQETALAVACGESSLGYTSMRVSKSFIPRCGLRGIVARIHLATRWRLLEVCCGLRGIVARIHWTTTHNHPHCRCGLRGIVARIHCLGRNSLPENDLQPNAAQKSMSCGGGSSAGLRRIPT